MRAGLLKYTLVFESPVEVKSATGAVIKEYREVFRCRALRRKQTLLSVDENAYEQFIGHTTVMQVRKYPQIKYGCRVRYADCVWEIRMIEPAGNELTLTLKKIDV
ncbi:head-tail adaptor protein [uncultured Bacteroides sp.]|uniref:phage head completion protein n=1 Tax=uncultured Bacteroides sp. TaxID=162156 RepID=UPI00204DDBAC|nr:head-tail adaptor protein [uncultured Bacteroides sp.]DAJ86866.1 MAG TPA: putative head-tail adaptor [Caudoviricetes sp.]